MDSYLVISKSGMYIGLRDKYLSYSTQRVVDFMCNAFHMSKKRMKWYLKGWIYKNAPKINFDHWWTDTRMIIHAGTYHSFQTQARMIANHLVLEEPMSIPSGRIYYMDVYQQPLEYIDIQMSVNFVDRADCILSLNRTTESKSRLWKLRSFIRNKISQVSEICRIKRIQKLFLSFHK